MQTMRSIQAMQAQRPMRRSRPLRRRAAGWAAALLVLAVLALVFAAYLNPHTMLDLANRFWACF